MDLIKKGEKLETILKNNPDLYPSILIQMEAVGESTGSLDEVLENISDFYEEEISQTMERLPTIIEPALMLLMGLGVAGIAVAVLMPIFSLSENF